MEIKGQSGGRNRGYCRQDGAHCQDRQGYNIDCLIYGQLVTHMVQQTSWNWGAKSGFFYGGIMGLGLIWAYFPLPESVSQY